MELDSEPVTLSHLLARKKGPVNGIHTLGKYRVTRNGETLSSSTSALLTPLPQRPASRCGRSWSSGLLGHRLQVRRHPRGRQGVDLRTWNLTETQRETLNFELRRRNVAAWLRGYGRDKHGPPPARHRDRRAGKYAQAARVQVIDYGKGLNGLANKGKDPYPRPKVVVPFPKTQPPARPMEDDVSVSDARMALAECSTARPNRSTPSSRRLDNDLKNIIKEANTDLEQKVDAILLALQEQAPRTVTQPTDSGRSSVEWFTAA